MAIEGPLRELGIHDVFQLLDLSRKTGTLAVTSELRDNEGTVLFENGRVVAATIKSNPHRIGDLLMRSGKVTEGDIARASAAQQERGDQRRLGEILLEMGAISPKELERQVRLQIEAVVFELLSWREGFFRFEEGSIGSRAMLQISTESLLMEGARRIDEWSRIADRVPSLEAVPLLAPVDDEHAGALDLLPSEWEVLAMIDGERNLRGIAAMLARSEFDVAKVVYGLVSTSVIELSVPSAVAERVAARQPTPPIPMRAVSLASEVTPVTPIAAVAAPVAPAAPAAPAASVAAPAPPVPPVEDEPADDLERGYRALRRGDFDGAVTAWALFLQANPKHERADRVRGGLEAAARLRSLVEARYGDG
jgi:hypothetical protein